MCGGEGAGDDGAEGVADHVQRQGLCVLAGGVGVLHKVVQPRHVRVDIVFALAVFALSIFGQVCGAAKAGQVGADDADVRDELQQVVRDDFQAVVVATETVHEQHRVGAFGEGSVVHAFAVLPVAGHDRLRAVTDEGVVAGAGNERAGYTLKN